MIGGTGPLTGDESAYEPMLSGAQAYFSYVDDVPELFVGSAATAIGAQHALYPWTMGLLPSFAGEGAVYGRQIAAHQPTAEIAVL